MRFPQAFLLLLSFVTAIHALALPTSFESLTEASRELFKRKGGGGSKGGGTSSGGSSSSARAGATSNTGGRTSSGTGVSPAYGGGRYYSGGASAPYTSGYRSPGGVAPYFLAGSALAFFPGLWLYGAYAYAYPHYYSYRNETTNQNETHPAQCYCARYAECGCEDTSNDTSYVQDVANDPTVSRVANVNGTDTLLINGTLENGTTAAGGSDDTSAAGSLRQGLAEMSGWWMVGAGVAYTMWFM